MGSTNRHLLLECLQFQGSDTGISDEKRGHNRLHHKGGYRCHQACRHCHTYYIGSPALRGLIRERRKSRTVMRLERGTREESLGGRKEWRHTRGNLEGREPKLDSECEERQRLNGHHEQTSASIPPASKSDSFVAYLLPDAPIPSRHLCS